MPDRQQQLHKLRMLKMARSAHAYVRGSTEQFYAWIASAGGMQLPAGPPVWICGDCHVGNLGPIGRAKGPTVIEIRDLDQATIGNPAFDLVRLGLSLAMASRSSLLPGVTTARMTELLVAGYERAFEGEIPSERPDALPAPIKLVMKRAIQRTSDLLLGERLGRRTRGFKLGRRFWPLTDDERAEVERQISTEAIRRLVTKLEDRADDGKLTLVDAAYWVKGCSSLGLWRGAALVELEDPARKKGERRSLCLLDFKQATEAVAPVERTADVPDDPAERVREAARRIAPALGERMVATKLLGHSVFVRELLPQDLKVELDQISREDGRTVAHYLGLVVGRAHARQLAPEARGQWLAELQGYRTKNIDAPSWLWHAVVDLVGMHERGYLEHCRRYALAYDE
ncbi:MAG TPA: DUF2252 family protein [Kofleriaceae bacterium]